MSSLKRKADGIEFFIPAGDYTGKDGYGVTLAGDVATLRASAPVPLDGVIREGGTVAQGISVAILGAVNGAVDFKISGVVARGAKLTQSNDGTVITDAGAGGRVQVAVANQGGVAADLIAAFPRTPLILA